MIIDRDIIVACNAGNEADACYFIWEDEAFEHYCEYGLDYIYTAFNQAEGWSRPMNDEFKDRLDRAQAACQFDREASRADRIRDERLERVP